MDPSKKYTTIHYHKYLELDKLLDSQKTRSGQFEDKAAHEEMLFIIVHQVYELWLNKSFMRLLLSVICLEIIKWMKKT